MKIQDDSAWLCVEKVKKHGFETTNLKRKRNKRNTIQVPIFYVALLIEITTPVEGQQNFCQLRAAAENCIGNYKIFTEVTGPANPFNGISATCEIAL